MKKILIVMLAVAITFSATAQGDKKLKRDNDHFKKENFYQRKHDDLNGNVKHKKLEEKKDHYAKNNKGKQLDKLDKKLDLSDNQGQRIKQVNQDYKERLQALKNNDQLSNDQKKQQAELLRQQHTENIKAVLTDEQRLKLKDQKKNRRKSGK